MMIHLDELDGCRIKENHMAKIILIQARPASRLDSRENLARALRLLRNCEGQEADLICFPEYFPY